MLPVSHAQDYPPGQTERPSHGKSFHATNAAVPNLTIRQWFSFRANNFSLRPVAYDATIDLPKDKEGSTMACCGSARP
jgi:hypothetical protein